MKKKKIKEPMSETKKYVYFCLINGVLWVWCSYFLAFFNRIEIAESLSKIAITEIIGIFLTYSLKSLFENLSKNNIWPDKSMATAKQELESEEESNEDSSKITPEEEKIVLAAKDNWGGSI